MSATLLNATKGLIFRITHVDNVPWLLANGVHCRSSPSVDPKFREIGNRELIAKRVARAVPVSPGGTLSDYVPFYFTPWSPMHMNITTGYGGMPHTPADEIAILVSSIPTLVFQGLKFVLTDRHAYLQAASFSNTASGLAAIDWPLLQSRDFKRTDADPGRFERYQAEALVHICVPTAALLGIVVRDAKREPRIDAELKRRGLSLTLKTIPDWYFR